MKDILQKTCYLFFAFFIKITAFSQASYNANQKVDPYNQTFMYGVNTGYYGALDNNDNTNGHDELTADLSAGNTTTGVAGAGIKTLRPALYGWFLKQYGYNIRLNTFKYYQTRGISQIAIFMNEPAAEDKDTIPFNLFRQCSPTSPLTNFGGMYKNLYEPIWVTNNGVTAVNPNNPYAVYLYNLVNVYGPYIDFYEVWNEPDFVSSQVFPIGTSPDYNVVEKWTTRDPHPCELVNMYAPIETYVRLLRISWEIIKTYDPTGRICTGGIGYPSFLDAVLRNTDNPVDGSTSTDFPLKGGAYFDVLSYHTYPQYQLQYWDNASNSFKYRRYSDAAADSAIIGGKRSFQNVLNKYGYNGSTFPKKHYIITETNIPKFKPNGLEHIGSIEAQRNYTIKTIVRSQMNGIKQLYFFRLGDTVEESDAANRGNNDGQNVMGMYKNLEKSTITAKTAVLTDQGIANKTTSTLIYGYTYDSLRTVQLNLTGKVTGAAFVKGSDYVYVLWAKTSTDNSETASATYSFPTTLKYATMDRFEWNYSSTKSSTTPVATNIALTGSPSFFKVKTLVGINDDKYNTANFEAWSFTDVVDDKTYIGLSLDEPENISINVYDLNGTLIENLIKNSYYQSGTYKINIESPLNKGIYICECLSNNGKKTFRFVK